MPINPLDFACPIFLLSFAAIGVCTRSVDLEMSWQDCLHRNLQRMYDAIFRDIKRRNAWKSGSLSDRMIERIAAH